MRSILLSASKKLQTFETSIVRQVTEAIIGKIEIRVLATEAFILTRFKRLVSERAVAKTHRDFAIDVTRLAVETCAVLFGSIAILATVNSQSEIDVPLLLFFGILIVRMLPISTRILSGINVIRTAIPSINVVLDRFNALDTNAKKPIVQAAYEGQGGLRIELKDASIGNDANQTLASNVNINVNSGQKVGLVGPSGSGKSTLIRTLLGLQSHLSGELCVNIDRHLYPHLPGKLVGYVPQKIFFTEGSIIENVLLGRDRIPNYEARVLSIFEKLDLIDWLESLPDGLNQLVGEQGAGFSGGQLQRIGIARALYNDPPVLNFDEATSALDEKTEEKVLDFVFSKEDTTVLFSTHRKATLARCDTSLTFYNGRILYNDLLTKQNL